MRVTQDGLQYPAFGLMNGGNVLNGWITNLLPYGLLRSLRSMVVSDDAEYLKTPYITFLFWILFLVFGVLLPQ